MISWPTFLSLVHLVGLALGAGAATVKLVLLLTCNADTAFVPTYLSVSKPITRLIVLGIILLTLSGIGWMFLGYAFSARLVVKIILVAAIWVLGPLIDNVVEPRYRRLAPASGAPASAVFVRVQREYLAWETAATLLFYVIIVIWVLR